MSLLANNRLIALVFAILALPACFAISAVLPPMQAPDEIAHFAYARSISLGQITAIDKGRIASGRATQSDAALMYPFWALTFDQQLNATSDLFANADATVIGEDPIIETDIMGAASYFPTSYFASASGIKLVDLFGGSALDRFYGGRAANTLMYVVLGVAALLMAPFGAPALLTILLIPMNLHQAASFSPDAYSFPAVALAVFLFLRSVKIVNIQFVLILTLATIITTIAALTRIPLIFLAILPIYLGVKYRDPRYVLSAIISVSTLIIWLMFFSYSGPTAAKLIALGHVSAKEQAIFLFGNPENILLIAQNTIFTQWRFYLEGTLGIFATLNVYMDYQYYLLIAAMLILASFISNSNFKIELGLRFVFLAIASFIILASVAAIYLTWSVVGSLVVDGFQGRYLIPALILLALALSNIVPAAIMPKHSGIAFLTMLALSHSVTLSHVIKLLTHRFYW